VRGEVYPLTEDSLRAAVEDFERLIKSLRAYDRGEDLGGRVRTRAQDMLTYAWSGGLLPTLTFYLAKAKGEDNIRSFKAFFETGERLPERLGLEEAAYAALFYLLLKRLKQLGFIKGSLEQPRECLRELIELDFFKRIYVLDLSTAYLLEFAKLCEARFGKKSE
jgi:CRISPR type III-B/RAMP module-associated protein Cmr5